MDKQGPDLIIRGRIPSKKNDRIPIRQKSGRIINIPSTRYQAWHKDASTQLSFQMGRVWEGIYGVEISFWMPDDRKTDLTNKTESIMDLLVDVGILKDDCWQVIKHVVLNCEGIDRENPRAEIWLKSLGGANGNS